MRTPAELDRIAKALDVVNNIAFLPHTRLIDGKPFGPITLCNDYVACFVAALGLELPLVSANDQHDWLADPANGWRPVDAIAAAMRAGLGFPVIASWKNPTGGHGHIAVVMPASSTGHLYVSAAGATNHVTAPIEKSFGLELHPDFFTAD